MAATQSPDGLGLARGDSVLGQAAGARVQAAADAGVGEARSRTRWSRRAAASPPRRTRPRNPLSPIRRRAPGLCE